LGNLEGMSRWVLAFVLTVLASFLPPVPFANAASPAGEGRSLYLVQVDGAPLASYTGGVAGIPRTAPGAHGKLERRAESFQDYKGYLGERHSAVLRAAGIPASRTVARYTTAFNGFAASLTPTEAARLTRTAAVEHVWKNEIRKLDSVPTFLGLDGPSGAWNTRFGDPTTAGAGVIIGMIDTGIWPESPSFAALPEPRPDDAIIQQKWFSDGVDKCDEGTTDPIKCNNKIIGARYYDASGLGTWDQEYRSPRDYDGHGSHTASTAAGDYNVPAVINSANVGQISGMAPAARIAVYKAMWRQADGEGSGGTVDLVQAIDDAVSDGVDIINYSVSGSDSTIADPVEIAFYNAAAAGVFVAASAGNEGPDSSTVTHDAPWTTTVAADSTDAGSFKSVTLGNGKTYEGFGQGPAIASAPLVDSVSAGAAGADPGQVELCYPGTLDPARVTGRIVLCKRGTNPRTDKSLAVRDAGGVGMILYNPTLNSLNADFHVIPTVHVGQPEGAAVKAYIASTKTPTASLSTTDHRTARAPEVAAFSSAGPALPDGGDLLKPDLSAPGLDIVAAVSPSGHHDNTFDGESGTSMSSPHVAGIAALIESAHPSWSVSEVKSALMTTASQTDNSGGPIQRDHVAATPFDFGSGHVAPAAAFDPGLVYDSGPSDWLKFGCALGQLQEAVDFCPAVPLTDPSDLNYPSISVGNLTGAQTVHRTVKNVSGHSSSYTSTVVAPAGFTVFVSPPSMTVPAAGSVDFTLRITRTTAAYDTWGFGSLTWKDDADHTVRSPIAVRASALAAPPSIAAPGSFTVVSGFSGTLTTRGYGLAPSTVETAHLTGADQAFAISAPAASASVAKFTVTVPPGSHLARFSTFDADNGPGSDLDLYAYRKGVLIDHSAGGTAEESVDLETPGTYDVYLVQFALPDGVPAQDVKGQFFVVGATGTSSMVVTPASATVEAGSSVPVTASWSGVDAGRRYLGVIEYGDGTAVRGKTVVSVGPSPLSTRSGPFLTRSGPSLTRSGPSLTRSGPSLTRSGPSLTRSGPS
jgi:subtilisin family serine protease